MNKKITTQELNIVVQKLNEKLPTKYLKLVFWKRVGRGFILYYWDDGNKLLRWYPALQPKEIDEALKTCHE